MSSPATSEESGGGAIGEAGEPEAEDSGDTSLRTEICAVLHPQLAVEAAHVRAHGVLAQPRERRDVDAAVPAHEQARDLALALAEALEGGRLLGRHAHDRAARAAEDGVAFEGDHRGDRSAAREPERRRQRVALRSRGEGRLGRVDEERLDRIDVFVPVDAVLAVRGPHDPLAVAVDDEHRPGHLAEGAKGGGLPRQLVVLKLAPGPRDDERRELFEAVAVDLSEGGGAGAALEARQAEEHAPLVQEEEESVREPVEPRLLAEIPQRCSLGLRPELVRGVRAPRCRDDALAIEAERDRQRDPARVSQRLALAVDQARRVLPCARVVHAEEAKSARRRYEVAHGVDHPPAKARSGSREHDLKLRRLELVHACCPILQSWPL